MSENSYAHRLLLLQGERSQKDFAAWLDVSPSRMNNYLRGVNLPDIDFLQRLLKRGISVDWFLSGKGSVFVRPHDPTEVPANVQVLLHEIGRVPGIVEDLTAFVRSKREMEESFEVVKDLLKRRKKGPE